MTDNPLLTQPVITSDGREAVVLHHRCSDEWIIADIQNVNGFWIAREFSARGQGKHCSLRLIPKPTVHPYLTGTRRFRVLLIPNNEGDMPEHYKSSPYAYLTLTDGDPASAVVEVVLPKGEG